MVCRCMCGVLSVCVLYVAVLQIQDLKGAIRVFCRIRPCKPPNDPIALYPSRGELGLDQCQVGATQGGNSPQFTLGYDGVAVGFEKRPPQANFIFRC